MIKLNAPQDRIIWDKLHYRIKEKTVLALDYETLNMGFQIRAGLRDMIENELWYLVYEQVAIINDVFGWNFHFSHGPRYNEQ